LLAMHDQSYPLSVPIETAANDALQFALLEDYCKVMDDAVLTALTSVTSDFDAAEYNSNMYRKFCRTILALRVSASLARIVELKRVGEGSTLAWVLEEPWRIRWWYFVLAFFVGLRLAKVTAEITQVRMQKKAK
jgi:hypothetical protein